MGLFSKLFGAKSSEEEKAFLRDLSSQDKVWVSNLNPLLYHSIIKEKKGEQAPAIVMEDQAALTALRRLRVDELEQLCASVEAAQEGDRAASSNMSRAAGITKHASCHTFRHSFATHHL